MSRCILGIDPGSKGAIACLWPEDGLLRVENVPVYKVQRDRLHTYVDGVKLGTLLRELKPDVAWLEEVHSMPHDGHVGAFTFGDNFGSLRTALSVLGINTEMIKPSVWKANLRASADKNDSRKRADLLFPHCAALFTRPDKAEAAMIALYGALHMGCRLKRVILPHEGRTVS
jgi:hypothetical protein